MGGDIIKIRNRQQRRGNKGVLDKTGGLKKESKEIRQEEGINSLIPLTKEVNKEKEGVL